jgi:uncharacterized beta-barrel protein YwiB (DUF1934 family)
MNVTFDIVTTIKDNGHRYQDEVEQGGQLYYKDGHAFLRYEEEIEGAGVVHNTLKVTGHEVKIIRHGAIRMNHLYSKGKVTKGTYLTPHGAFDMETKTTEVSLSPFEKGKGEFRLHYFLTLNQETAGEFAIVISIKEEK